jgi:dTDP-4-dehydrorhamnose reductase
VVPLTRADLDLADFPALRDRFNRDSPALVFHCAALSRSPVCEKDPKLARLLNVDVPAMLTDLCRHSCLVFFSTDLVFDGAVGNYDEAAPVSPLGVYAQTKADAERIVLSSPRHLVIRTSLNGGTSPTGDRGFNEQMRRAWVEGKTLRLFEDEFRSPISAEVTALATWELALAGANGVFHVAGTERLSRWNLGQLMAARWTQLSPLVERSSLSEYQGAPRAPDTSMNCSKAQKLLSFQLPKFSQWLAQQPPGTF